jgi:hypothetical protein
MPGGDLRPILVGLLLALPLAGCLEGRAPAATTGPSPTDAVSVAPAQFACSAALLFELVDETATDAYLPPGFHPRDPQDFLGTPVAFGQAGILVIAVSCQGPSGRLDQASVDIFVEHPAVGSLAPADFDFYELERYGPPDQLGGALQSAHWPFLTGTPHLAVSNGTVERAADVGKAYRTVFADVSDENGPIYSFNGVASGNYTLGPRMVRFWHDAPDGLSAIDYATRLDTQVGGGDCSARPGTSMAGFISSGTLGQLTAVAGYGCPPGTPVIASFPVGFALNATVARLPGVHAG